MGLPWAPNYTEEIIKRQRRLLNVKNDPSLALGAKSYYADKPKEFIEHWCITYDPRNSAKGLPTTMPFIPFDRQCEFIEFITQCVQDEESGLVEKSRDMGATWICCALSVWMWLFKPGISIGWGSRKEILVDKIGDPDSIFQKMRMIIDSLPRWMWPEGFDRKEHTSYMKIINPETGSTITGEAGDNIGRGGRKAVYFKDESAHYERPENIEASLGDTTNCQIDISSVHGTGNVFHRRRQAGEMWEPGSNLPPGKTRVFIFDWRDHPLKTQAWYDLRRNKAEQEGLLHLFAQEVDRDSAAAVEGVLIPPEWVKAAIDAHLKLGFDDTGLSIAALDVADEGGDKNAFASRKGNILDFISMWAEGDTTVTANKAVGMARTRKVSSLQYDCIGVGAGVKGETNRMIKAGSKPSNLQIVPWNAASSPLFPNSRVIYGDRESPTNKDFYSNLKAQAWWNLRGRFEKTYHAITHKKKYKPDELISLSSKLKLLHQVVAELSQPTYKYDGKSRIIVDKKPSGTRSPNLADAIVMAFFPIQRQKVLI